MGEEVLYINHLQFLFHFYPKSILMAQLLIMYVSEQKKQIRVSQTDEKKATPPPSKQISFIIRIVLVLILMLCNGTVFL